MFSQDDAPHAASCSHIGKGTFRAILNCGVCCKSKHMHIQSTTQMFRLKFRLKKNPELNGLPALPNLQTVTKRFYSQKAKMLKMLVSIRWGLMWPLPATPCVTRRALAHVNAHLTKLWFVLPIMENSFSSHMQNSCKKKKKSGSKNNPGFIHF